MAFAFLRAIPIAITSMIAIGCADLSASSIRPDCSTTRTSVVRDSAGAPIYIEGPQLLETPEGVLVLGGPAWRFGPGGAGEVASVQLIAGAWMASDTCGISATTESLVPLPPGSSPMNVVRAAVGPGDAVVAWEQGDGASGSIAMSATLSRSGWSQPARLLADARRLSWVSSQISNVASSGRTALLGVPVLFRDSLYLLRAAADGWERRTLAMTEHVYSRLALVEEGKKLAAAYVTAGPLGSQHIRVRVANETDLGRAADTVLHGTGTIVEALEINGGADNSLIVSWLTPQDSLRFVFFAAARHASPWRTLTPIWSDADAVYISRPAIVHGRPVFVLAEQHGSTGMVTLLSYDRERWHRLHQSTFRGLVLPQPTLHVSGGRLIVLWGAVPEGKSLPSTWMATVPVAGPS